MIQHYNIDERELARRMFRSDEIYQAAKIAFGSLTGKMNTEELFGTAVALTKEVLALKNQDILSFISTLSRLKDEIQNEDAEMKILILSSMMFYALNKDGEQRKKQERLLETARNMKGFEEAFTALGDAEQERMLAGHYLDRMNYGIPSLRFSASTSQEDEKIWDIYRNLLCEKMESLEKGQTETWLNGNDMAALNLSILRYDNANSLMMLLHAEKQGYKHPIFCTQEEVERMNFKKDKRGKRVPVEPKLMVKPGEKPFPVIYTKIIVEGVADGKRISVDEYNCKPLVERAKYHLVREPLQTMTFGWVYNIEQTNLKEVRPELYADMIKKMQEQNKDGIKEEMLDSLRYMENERKWICPIVREGEEDYYSISKNQICVQNKDKYDSEESCYTHLLHEMAHSTGASDRMTSALLNKWGYDKEELIAELAAAVVAQQYGLKKTVKGETCHYLNAMIEGMENSPLFVKNLLFDMKEASRIMVKHIENMIAMNKEQKQTNEVKPIYYASVAYLQFEDSTAELDKLKENGNYEGLLALAKEYYDGDAMDEEHTYKKPCQNRGDNLLIEDENFAVVYNGSVGGTYEVFVKYSEQDIRDHITRYGVGRSSEDVKEVARKMIADEFSKYAHGDKMKLIMQNGEIRSVSYNQESNQLEVGQVESGKFKVEHSFPYDYDSSFGKNMVNMSKSLLSLPEYQEEQRSYGRRF